MKKSVIILLELCLALTPLGCLGEEATFIPGQPRDKATLGYDTMQHLAEK